MASLLVLLNRLLPFATPGTPLLQDLLHLSAICILLYFAPQIQQSIQSKSISRNDDTGPNEGGPPSDDNDDVNNAAEAQDNHDIAEAEFDVQDDAVVNEEPRNVPEMPLHDHVQEGDAGPARAPQIPARGNVGAKKAKSLARKDQRRAYNEFMRSQGDAQRARDAEGASEREAALEAEKERRRVAELAIESQKMRERELKREQEERQRKEDLQRRELVVSIVKEELEGRKMCDLFKVAKQVGGDVDEEWVERVLKGSSLIGRKGSSMTMLTEMGWAVRVTSDDMAQLYEEAVKADLGDEHGRIDNDELGKLLETILRDDAKS